MPRYILRRRKDRSSHITVHEIASLPGVQIVDSEIPGLLLIETDTEDIAALRERIVGWTLDPERDYTL